MHSNAKCFILTASGYEEITYGILTERRENDPSYMNRRFIPLHGMLLEVREEDYKDFYRDKRRQKYLQEESVRVDEVSYNALDTDEMSGEEAVVDPSPLPDAEVVDKLMLETMRRCLDKLDSKNRDLIQAVYFDGKSERTMAKELGITQPTVHYRVTQALAKIKKMMEI